MAAKYELPEEVNEKCLRTLGREVEMKTFKTNVDPDGEAKDSSRKSLNTNLAPEEEWNDSGRLPAPLVKIICVGDYTGGRDKKGVFIEDYLQVRCPLPLTETRTPTTRVGRYFKMIRWLRKDTEKSF